MEIYFVQYRWLLILALREPTALQLEKEGYGHVVASLGKLGGEVPYTSYMTKKSYFNSNPDIIEKFVKGLQKGIDYTFNHSDSDIAKIIADHFPDTSLNDLTEVVKRYRENDSWYETTYITEEGFKRVQDIMKNSGQLNEFVSYKDLVNNKYSNKK